MARKMFVEFEDPVAGKRVFARNPIRMSKAKEVPPVRAPRLGEHTESVLKDFLKYDEEKVEALRKEKII
jgi:crotonobetainyl-CoA:carnitine CoA-transferase CaiB-like acyl-CoA transferase